MTSNEAIAMVRMVNFSAMEWPNYLWLTVFVLCDIVSVEQSLSPKIVEARTTYHRSAMVNRISEISPARSTW